MLRWSERRLLLAVLMRCDSSSTGGSLVKKMASVTKAYGAATEEVVRMPQQLCKNEVSRPNLPYIEKGCGSAEC